MSTVIKVENISKQYRLGEIGTGTISHDLNRWWHKVRGKEDPYLKIGEANDRTAKGTSDYVWALQNINFEVKQGEVLGIIGRNGAGKSTLLKILSKTTTPTTGSIKVKGRIASLLEVGTGFHPELSGRENIFLNGAILGMRKNEIKRKFDEIVDFSGVERYIDTPVKRYSSGMYVRLAFAVAAHLEPEILIVDEVLAVGDAEFQKKCLGKMKDVSVNEGRTVLFVSHDMNAISLLTDNTLVMQNGSIGLIGKTSLAVDFYFANEREIRNLFYEADFKDGNKAQLTHISIETTNSNNVQNLNQKLVINFRIQMKQEPKNLALAFQILNTKGIPVAHMWLFEKDILSFSDKNNCFVRCIMPKCRLYLGDYTLKIFLAEDSGKTMLEIIENICPFKVEAINESREFEWQPNTCYYLEDFYWESIEISDSLALV